MKIFYQIFLVLFVIFIGVNLYAINWRLGIMHEDNTKFVMSISAAVLGIILVFVLNTWSRLSAKK